MQNNLINTFQCQIEKSKPHKYETAKNPKHNTDKRLINLLNKRVKKMEYLLPRPPRGRGRGRGSSKDEAMVDVLFQEDFCFTVVSG